MKFCPQCGTQLDDAAVVCTNCGANLAAAPQAAPQAPYYAAPVAPVVPVYDHTAEFTAQEISEGKVFGIAIYLLGVLGIIIALLGSRDNKFVAFHIRNWLKIEICSVLGVIIGAVIPFLGWFVVLPVVAIIVFVLTIIAFFNVCNGKAIDAPIIRAFGFLK